MITNLNHTDKVIASKIREVFQVSYAVEAKLLDAEDNFPPLNRTLSAFIKVESTFYGYYESEHLAGVVEVKNQDGVTHIQSLVVDPQFFRRGIASKLVRFVLSHFNSSVFTVETGAANDPAIALYKQHDFIIVKQWMTEVGIEKVAFERIVN